MTQNQNVILFDLFGVVFSKGLESSMDHLKAAMGVEEQALAKAYRRWEEEFDLGRINEQDYWARVNHELGTNVSSHMLSRIVIDSYRMNVGVADLMEFASKNPTAIFSNYRREWFDRLDAKWKVSTRVDEVFISSDLGERKPSEASFLLVAKELGCRVSDLVLIDDEAANVRSLELLGGVGIPFRSPFSVEVDLRASATVKLPEYSDHYSGIFLRTPSGGLVFQRRDDLPGVENAGRLSVFGGRRRPGESSQDCALRELAEETTLRVEFSSLCFLGRYSHKEKTSGGWIEAEYYIIDNVDLDDIDVREGSGLEVWYAQDAIHRRDLTSMPRQVILDHFLE